MSHLQLLMCTCICLNYFLRLFCLCYLLFVCLHSKTTWFILHRGYFTFLSVGGWNHCCRYRASASSWSMSACGRVHQQTSWRIPMTLLCGKIMGCPGYPCSRIGLQGCTDGFQAHVDGSLSMKPFMLTNFSLSPALWFKTQFMFLMILVPVNVKGYGLKKYFDFADTFELNSLYYTGESDIKVKIFICSMDTPDRHELLGSMWTS